MTATAQLTPNVRVPHAVRLTGVRKTFSRGADSVPVLDGVDLEVGPGEFVCLLGASGCGKSTMLNLVAGLDVPTEGTISPGWRRPAMMFQDAALLPWLTAARNVELPLRLAGVGRARRRARAEELLGLVRLSGVGGRRPHELSGGMRQRVSLARALASIDTPPPAGAGEMGPGGAGCPLLLMDEPFAALDAITRDVLQSELLRVWRANGMAVLFVTHDVQEAVRLGQRVVLLSSRPGRVHQEWRTADVTDRDGLIRDITGRLREVISAHATV
ncbi:ABC transporter ATP-binding protein [Actinoalloteichus sp. AHMU CJ021]|uniref:NitT/TauT family transport system ATP-binding protein n=1 Tax=Actinoalloteichus caeruleus DSM 43889 TaxID=1120930 RepID=A0ABT1JC83_ACTCY|nr:ABC transporter ATP-binding protein [Actinoalloteichus caeruleus]AUS80706.1 ABC transporter ATP-binding protein [Actinoalloteichus sp. AHMU CJ021]MCP2330099.1 NitT/TauT family transport system ATP-binding protein [Actinoalloteichus caeruleus DSM 43889]